MGENYYVFNDELYMLIDHKRINDNKFKIKFLNNVKYKFDLKKLNKTNNELGCVYTKKFFGFPKILFKEKSAVENDIFINYSNLFFIIVLY